ncbi:ABC transporter substrate-binding protein [Paenibacillus sp. alder61]|uniref:ABC transporter substrate-binding protein n=1 Tax=Paenibacillus faecis TaxID=862114 RepID=A0A5D0CYR4_9BACL|nr:MULTISPECIES: ABC transporter substrate-binding protein [Paenibacillus]MCA1294446.1 ABC transporter substrate-binding protein [Paenibacillus sp. alder61]TYA15189.1 ABC transporter substrate-binding protein [Paenibacillus faecis]
MKQTKWAVVGLLFLISVVFTACGEKKEAAESPSGTEKAASAEQAETRIINYLGKEYKVPAKTDRIVITGAVEAMEDAIVLDVKPVGAITVGGQFPELFRPITGEAQSVGEKTEPNFETILSLKPDVILGSTKFKPEVMEQLAKIAPTLPYSHVSTDWESNLRLLGELSGKQEQAEQEIAKYKSDLEDAKTKLNDSVKGAKVLAMRIRVGELYIYPEKVFFNPVLYEDLGLTAPAEVKAAKAQELLSKERLAEMNPDYIFLQFSPDENKESPNALEQFQNDPILKNVAAVKNGKLFINAVDPLIQGGTAYSKIEFLKAAVDRLTK